MEAVPMASQDTGGPDDFGYTWDDSVALSWIDATSGTDADLSGWGSYTGPVSIGFPFKYYENTYTELYITASGYVSFDDEALWDVQGHIPEPSTPNNMIAPYWTPLEPEGPGPTNRVYYLQGGSAPNRYFVIEWYEVVGTCCDGEEDYDIFTFEAVLYENGDILFQYLDMTYTGDWWCGHAGIEDSTGLDGLAYGSFCQQYASNKAVRFYRPPPSARMQIRPLYQGRFTHAGETVAFHVPIRNTGELGSDTYDLPLASGWSATLYAADGVTPLTDSDSDGTVDTGPVAQGSSTTVIVKTTTPDWATVGDDNTAVLTVRSSLDTGKSKVVTLQTAVPVPFAQVYRDNADGAMSLYLARSKGPLLRKVTSDGYYGYDMAVAETPDGDFVYAWSKYRWTGSVSTYELRYALLNPCGQRIRGVTQLTDHSGVTMSTYDYSPAVAVAPNGNIGFLWYRYLYNSTDYTWNYNIYYAILGAAGNVVVSPTNLTNNSIWGSG